MNKTFRFHRHKFNAVRTTVGDRKFSSKSEARYYQELLDRKVSKLNPEGDVLFFLQQVPFHLPGGVRFVLDFLVFYVNGDIKFIDVKGMETPEFKIKKKIVEATYPIQIELIKYVKVKKTKISISKGE
jgi:hypothetical protein